MPEILNLAFGWPGGTEWIVLLVLGLLVFGRRLPDVGRNIGRSIVEFKKGIKGIEDDIDDESEAPKTRKRIDEPPPARIEDKKAKVGPEHEGEKAAVGSGESENRTA
jgi:sec-independent protein translocase protein TatA